MNEISRIGIFGKRIDARATRDPTIGRGIRRPNGGRQTGMRRVTKPGGSAYCLTSAYSELTQSAPPQILLAYEVGSRQLF